MNICLHLSSCFGKLDKFDDRVGGIPQLVVIRWDDSSSSGSNLKMVGTRRSNGSSGDNHSDLTKAQSQPGLLTETEEISLVTGSQTNTGDSTQIVTDAELCGTARADALDPQEKSGDGESGLFSSVSGASSSILNSEGSVMTEGDLRAEFKKIVVPDMINDPEQWEAMFTKYKKTQKEKYRWTKTGSSVASHQKKVVAGSADETMSKGYSSFRTRKKEGTLPHDRKEAAENHVRTTMWRNTKITNMYILEKGHLQKKLSGHLRLSECQTNEHYQHLTGLIAKVINSQRHNTTKNLRRKFFGGDHSKGECIVGELKRISKVVSQLVKTWCWKWWQRVTNWPIFTTRQRAAGQRCSSQYCMQGQHNRLKIAKRTTSSRDISCGVHQFFRAWLEGKY